MPREGNRVHYTPFRPQPGSSRSAVVPEGLNRLPPSPLANTNTVVWPPLPLPLRCRLRRGLRPPAGWCVPASAAARGAAIGRRDCAFEGSEKQFLLLACDTFLNASLGGGVGSALLKKAFKCGCQEYKRSRHSAVSGLPKLGINLRSNSSSSPFPIRDTSL